MPKNASENSCSSNRLVMRQSPGPMPVQKGCAVMSEKLHHGPPDKQSWQTLFGPKQYEKR